MNKNKILKLFLSIMLFFCPLSSKGFAVNIPGYVDLDEVQFEISPLHERFGEFGDYFYGNIPKEEDKDYQIAIVNEIFNLYKKINGVDYNNPSLFNGMTSEQLINKVLKPAAMVLDEEVLPEFQYNLIYVIADCKTFQGAFDKNCKFPFFVNTSYKDMFDTYSFDESFLGHYDNIFVVQLSGRNTFDNIMDITMPKIEKIIGENNCTDLIYMAHGTNKNLAVISSYGSIDARSINLSDFYPVEKGGNIYAQSLKNICDKEINGFTTSRVIGVGCSSDFLQECIDTLLGDDSFFIKVFGTPYSTNGLNALGFIDNNFIYYAFVSPYRGLFALDIKLGERKFQKDAEKFNTLLFDKSNLADIIVNDHKEGKDSGIVYKRNGVYMEYKWVDVIN